MKTAISVPDDVFEEAERLIRDTRRSRSELYTLALTEYLARHAPDRITEAMDHTEEDYGPSRLIEHFQQPDACVDGLIAEVQRFGARSDRTDDATAVLIRSR